MVAGSPPTLQSSPNCAHALLVPDQRRRGGPAFEGGFELGFWDGVELVVDPDRVPPALVRDLRHSGHRFILLNRVRNPRQLRAPALGDEDAKFHCHDGSLEAMRVEVRCTTDSDGYRCTVEVSDASGKSHHMVRASA